MTKKGNRKKTRRRKNRKGHPKSTSRPTNQSSWGRSIGSTLGGMLGNFAQKGLGELFGMGEYKEGLAGHLGVESKEIHESAAPAVNSLVQPLSSNEVVPLMHMDREGMVRVVRREFVDLIYIDAALNLLAVKINPGKNANFPWLSSIAQSFQMYAFSGIAYEYVPTSGMAVGTDNPALGQVSMAINYDPSVDPTGWPNDNIKGLLNMSGAVSGSPAAPSVCYVECDPVQSKNPIRYVLNESTTFAPAYMSLADYDLGYLTVATEGSQNTDMLRQCGQLWVTYDVMLFQPRPVNPSPALQDFLGPWAEPIKNLHLLLNCNGPFSPEELLIVQGEIRRLYGKLQSNDYRDYCEAMKIKMYRDRKGLKDRDVLLPDRIKELIDNSAVSRDATYNFPENTKLLPEGAGYERKVGGTLRNQR